MNEAILINPRLYRALKKWSTGSVRVKRAGIPLVAGYETGEGGNVRMVVRPGDQGEEYFINCPKCGDTRGRLSISHRWGVRDRKTNSRNLWLINCYNEGCYRDYSSQHALYDNLFFFTCGGGHIELSDLKAGDPSRTEAFRAPGAVWNLDDIASRSPRHPALEYLRSRFIDPLMAYQQYGFTYCVESPFPYTSDRLIIPVLWRGRLVGWQARMLGEPPKEGPPKYYTGPCSNLTNGYNLEQACQYYTKVLVEGPLDVLGIGPQAWALLNKTLSSDKLASLHKELDRYEDVGTFVVMLDPKQNKKERDKGIQHQQEAAYERLTAQYGQERVCLAYLPENLDPGSMFPGTVWEFIQAVAAEQNVFVSQETMRPR